MWLGGDRGCGCSLVHGQAAWCAFGMQAQLLPHLQPSNPLLVAAGAKTQELQAELERLQEDVPALQARAADLELQLAKAQEVRLGLGAVVRATAALG